MTEEPDEGIYANTLRMPSEKYRRLRRAYSAYFEHHESSWNAWILNMVDRGVSAWLTELKEKGDIK